MLLVIYVVFLLWVTHKVWPGFFPGLVQGFFDGFHDGFRRGFEKGRRWRGK